MKKLFAFYLGGSVEGFSIEVHNLQFGIGYRIEDCFEELKHNWKGSNHKVHIDSYCALEVVAGYQVNIIDRDHKPENSNDSTDPKKLYAIYYGWSEPNYLGEKHTIEFTVAKTEMEAIKNVHRLIDKTGKNDLHVDNRIEIDGLIDINSVIGSQYSIELTPTDIITKIEVINAYQKI